MPNPIKIGTDVIEPRVAKNWQEQTTYLPEIVAKNGWLSNIRAAITLIPKSFQFDVLILASNRKSSIFTILYSLLPVKRKTPILMIDCLWYIHPHKLRYLIKRLQLRIMSKCITKFIVWASHEVDDYSKAFSIPRGKFIFVPYHHTLEGYEFEVTEGDYIFSGGDGDRDYPTLIRAMQQIDCKLIIATRRKDWHGNLPVKQDIAAFPATHSDFRNYMAGSKLVVVPMKKGLLHSGGQQTYLNAMAMGKPVIVADDFGARDYIDHGVNGLIVCSADSKRLSFAIETILKNERLAACLANNALMTRQKYSTSVSMDKLLLVANKTVNATRKSTHNCLSRGFGSC